MAASKDLTGSGELIVEGLSVAYGAHSLAIEDVHLRVGAGETLAVLGSNGAGKTTTVRAITGVLGSHSGRIVKGSIRLNGVEIAQLSPFARVRAGIAQCMEGRRVFSELSIDDNLRAGAITRRDNAAILRDVEAVYGRFPDLAGRRKEKAGYLSGGQQQMLAIGRALMARPSVLLLDEPSLGLAPKLVEMVAETIAEIKSQGTTVLLIEQNVAMSLDLSDHAVVLETGRVVLSGPTAELRNNPRIHAAYLGGHTGAAAV
ncbi:ABC transporter ATP-binding protein [Arthrobacter sp. AZCC_0090]|uniref:ABC transporter ATP-binding protein n=1 Tax=Arthrobacter sp. AZCC_0090 TaxID=2735881 RepID=UPI0017CC5FDB|nr:ABC transporter ATP-binding protein [Arthrobacter sp. AZCC_0090]MBB6407162.1 branched-chain amino acid transport system ATP-binding protein [Arthrobacter sp. AZCC_0090]